MLVLGRKEDQSIVIDGNILIKVMKIKGKTVRLGVEAAPEVPILRAELDRHSESASLENPACSLTHENPSEYVEYGSLI